MPLYMSGISIYMRQLSKYRSIDALYDRDEVIILDGIGHLQTIVVDGIEQKVLSKQILRNAPHHLHIPFLSTSIGDAAKLKTIMHYFVSFRDNYKIMTLFQKVEISDETSWLIYHPKKVIAIMVANVNRYRHYVAYYLNDKNEVFKVKGKFVRLEHKKLAIYKCFEFLVKNDEIHCEDKWAAKIKMNQDGRTEEIFFWFQNNHLHNMTGPAVIHRDEKHYFTHGIEYKP